MESNETETSTAGKESNEAKTSTAEVRFQMESNEAETSTAGKESNEAKTSTAEKESNEAKTSTAENKVVRIEAEEDVDLTCCSRAVCCCCLRQILINSPVFKYWDVVTWVTVFACVTNIITGLLAWALMYLLTGDLSAPGGAIFNLFFLVVCAYCLGWGLTYIPYLHLPPVFGMLVAGIIARNSGLYNIRDTISSQVMGSIRNFCLTFVMVRSGIQLNTTPLRTHPISLMVLALLPCTIEMVVLTLCFKGFLGFPWDWAFLGGCVIACMSPVVTVTCLLALADQGFGEDKDISGFLCAASSIDGVHIMAIFSIAFSIVFDENEKYVWSYLPRGLRDLAFGFGFGTIMGLFFVFFPHQNSKYATFYRIINLSLGALCFGMGATTFFITGGGFLATVLMGFVACTGWKMIVKKFNVKPIRNAVAIMWHILQPVLCGVIGADVNFSHWTITRTSLYAVCIIIGLFARLSCAILATLKMPYTMSERIFVAISWLPKGTVQAALAPMAYEHALAKNDTEVIELAEDVFKVSVMAIVVLAPFGAMLMMITGPYLLNRIENDAIVERRLQSLRALSMKTKIPIAFNDKTD